MGMWWLVATLALANQQGAMSAPGPRLNPEGLSVCASREGATVVLQLEVPDGLHVYGRKERNGMPLKVYVGDETVRARIPPGLRVDQGEGFDPAYWLKGIVRIEVPTAANVGELRVQACSDNTCYPPERLPWTVVPPVPQ